MNDFQMLKDFIGSFQPLEWILPTWQQLQYNQYLPHFVSVMHGTDYHRMVTPQETSCQSYNSKWPHAWIDDRATCRTPLLVFEFISASPSTIPPSRWFGLYGLNVWFWMNLVTLQLMMCLFVALPIAVVMYYLIILPQKEPQSHVVSMTTTQPTKNLTIAKGTSIIGYMLGWLVLLPFWIIAPSPMATAAGIDNIIIRFFVCGTTPTLAIFRTLEAMYGFTPSHAITSVYSYALYFTSPLLLYPKTESNNKDGGTYQRRREWLTLVYRAAVPFGSGLVVTGLYQSYLRQVRPYAKGPASTPAHLYTWSSVRDVHLWYETLLYALLLQFYLATCSSGLAFTTIILTGRPTQPISDAPLQHCTSPSDFWGRRWNNLIHTCLKNGVFKPIRSLGGPTTLAVFATFIASGLFHEWLLPATIPDYPHTHGLAIAFFLWNAILVAVEMMIGARLARWFASGIPFIPRPLITIAVISMGLPVGHWFLDSYMRSDLFKHGQFCFPMILSIPAPNDASSSIPRLFSFSF